jgi:hypothetical protein
MLIITGTGRCGTATLARMLKGHHEFRVQYLLDKYFLKADPLSDPFRSIQRRIEAMLDLHQGIDRGTFIDSSNLYIYFIDALCALDPSTRVILLVRNGKDFARSALSRRWHEQNIFGTFPLPDDPYCEKWPSMTPLQKNAWIWVFRNTRALEGLKTVHEGRKLIVKVEDMREPQILDRIEAFAGVGTMERTLAEKGLNANPTFALPPKEEWSDSMNRDFDEIAGGMMRIFGYAR